MLTETPNPPAIVEPAEYLPSLQPKTTGDYLPSLRPAARAGDVMPSLRPQATVTEDPDQPGAWIIRYRENQWRYTGTKAQAEAWAKAFQDATKAKPAQAAAVRTSGYPVRPNSGKTSWWTGCPNWQHMNTASKHKDKFPVEWLKGLTNAELQSLHSDDHEDRVKWDYVPKKAASPPRIAMPKISVDPFCPTGH